ncbi:MAG: hypothetical protein E7441_06945 [Ruminococcaceae bacterium]|nr:hypothetical protein [Oscillospiraceae bacterium]
MKKYIKMLMLFICFTLSACSSTINDTIMQEEAKEKLSTHIGDWGFCMQADDEIWKIDISLSEENICQILCSEEEDGEKSESEYMGSYKIVQSLLEIPENMLEDVENIDNCVFLYSSEKNVLVSTFDGCYITFVSVDNNEENSFELGALFESAEELNSYLSENIDD